MSTQEPFYINLKKSRKKHKIDLEEISKNTNINKHFLEINENGDFHKIPEVYIRLFLRSYSFEIGEDPDKIIEEYEFYTNGSIINKQTFPSLD